MPTIRYILIIYPHCHPHLRINRHSNIFFKKKPENVLFVKRLT